MDLTQQVNASIDASTNTFFVEIKFLDSILGGNPKSPEVFRNHIEARLRREAKSAVKRGDKPPSEDRIQEIVSRSMEEMFGSDVDTTISEQEEKAHTTFKSNEHGPYIESRQVKAMLREMMSTLGITQSKRGSKQTYQHLLAVQMTSCSWLLMSLARKVHGHASSITTASLSRAFGSLFEHLPTCRSLVPQLCCVTMTS